jgi:hypothetical protein
VNGIVVTPQECSPWWHKNKNKNLLALLHFSICIIKNNKKSKNIEKEIMLQFCLE